MNRSLTALVIFTVSMATAGCSTDVEETREPAVAVELQDAPIAPRSLSCGLATAGMSITTRSCSGFRSGSLCTDTQATCSAHWVGLQDGFFEFYWTYRTLSTEWIPVKSVQQ